MLSVNGITVSPTLFPDNTSQVWLLPEELLKQDSFEINWDFSHEGEVMQLAQLRDLLVAEKGYPQITLKIKYLPYGRQDKNFSNKTTFALRTFADILNVIGFDKVTIMDPHSKVALDLIEGSVAEYPIKLVNYIVGLTKTTFVCYPDKGATTKYVPIYKLDAYFEGEKVRDQITGKITKYSVKNAVGVRDGVITPKDQTILIVDDICDGGATFVILAKELYAAGAKEVNLFVTHGLFSKGLRPLKEAGIKRIFTQDGEASEIQNNIAYRRL